MNMIWQVPFNMWIKGKFSSSIKRSRLDNCITCPTRINHDPPRGQPLGLQGLTNPKERISEFLWDEKVRHGRWHQLFLLSSWKIHKLQKPSFVKCEDTEVLREGSWWQCGYVVPLQPQRSESQFYSWPMLKADPA